MSELMRVILCFVLCCIFGVVRAQEPCEEPNVAVIVLASVFGTLAVVFITLGIICFLLWKRRRDLSRPPETPEKNNLKDNDQSARSPDGGFANPAFSETDGQGDLGLAEEGAGGYVRCKEYVTPEKKSVKDGKKDSNKKTWNSLPRSDLPPGPTHNGSIGSLDDHFLSADPEVTSVWLQSQDFIGLGFNIAGSMRDGIYVSQVHNRGPAVESGKFKIGDRILSVTISFENMVYEDALTILSYASPYPVKVTLQKEQNMSKNRKPSDAYSNLSHPLYRSQSVDTISKIGKDPTFVPKRSLSLASQNILEDRLKKSPLMTKFSLEKESFRESQEILKPDTSFSELRVDTNLPISTTVEINTPPEEANKNVEEVFQKDEIVNNESAPSVSTLPPPEEFTEEDDGKPPPEPLVPPPPLDFDTTDAASTTQVSSVAAEYSALFDSLNEQDKLDMLRLSYEDPDDSFNYSQNTVSMDTSLTEGESSSNTVIDMDPKSPPPIKPERRKKKSSSGSVSSAEPSPRLLPEPDGVEDDVIAPVSMENVQCLPSVDSEINEDVIMPERKTRDVSILSKSIEFSVISNNIITTEEEPESPRNSSKTLVDYSLSDMENTVRPHTPENNVVEEDMITPVQNKRGSLENSLKLFSNSDISVTPTPSSVSYSENLKDSGSDHSETDRSETKGANTTIGSVDFNLNMTSDPTLFSTPYPSRNTKEASSGVSYDISMMELNDIENKLKKEPKEMGKGGISFEIRDDMVSGGTMLTSVSKTVSNSEYHVSRTRSYQDVGGAEKIKVQRPASFKEDYSTACSNEENDNSLEWSGKRLVRAGSFPEIAQDTEQDWEEHNRVEKEENEDSSIGNNHDLNSSEESLEQSERKGLSKTTMFRARENLANLSSENSDSLQSITSSSRGSTPPPPYSANGNEDQGLGTSPESTPIKVPLNINDLNTSGLIDVIPTDTSINTDNSVVTSTVESNSNFAVTVETSHGDEADC